ncbi:MAG: molybdopterin molybdotransferase MoeA [Coriobacteriales bacterium]|jgi:molybdopterin molybdotransferase|nr:molybdopterin molybdotransferase MoeA [Coriobacteriales bacterium]
MSTQYASKEMIRVEEALDRALGIIEPLETERVSLTECGGRVLAQDIVSDVDIAAFDNSAMDGFALRFEDIQAASAENPITLPIAGHLGAGSVYEGSLEAGKAIRIMTGAPLPQGADTVVKIENVEVIGESEACPAGAEVRIGATDKAPKRGDNVRLRGEEAKAGDVLLCAGERLTPVAVGLIASGGTAQVPVYRQPRVAVFSMGSELTSAAETPKPGQIRDSNGPALAAAAQEAGALVTLVPHIEDSREALRSTFQELAHKQKYDLVVLSGGAAEGDFDFTASVIREMGEILFNKVCMRPGKAQTLGVIDGVPVFGLPGNPAAAVVGFEVLVRPLLRKMQGFVAAPRPVVKARVTQDIKKREPRRFYLRARLEREASGELVVTPAKNQSSALLSSSHASNCLLILPEGLNPATAGDVVDCVCVNITEGEVV